MSLTSLSRRTAGQKDEISKIEQIHFHRKRHSHYISSRVSKIFSISGLCMGANRDQNIIMNSSISPCNEYIALIRHDELQIYTFEPSKLHSKFNLPRCFSSHRETRGWESTNLDVKVHLIEWEHSLGVKCGKIALNASDENLQAVIIFDLSDNSHVFIEQDKSGVDKIQWIRGASPNSAYVNDSQVAVFSKYNLECTIYLLACTRALMSIPKPLLEIIQRDEVSSLFWSIVSLPYFPKHLLNRSVHSENFSPILWHFFTSGDVSTPAAAMTLDFMPGPEFRALWSQRQRWLLLVDKDKDFNGYTLRVFNFLAINKTQFPSVTKHRADATLEFKSRVSENSHFLWGLMSDHEYVVALPEYSSSSFRAELFGVTKIVTRTCEADLADGATWDVVHDFDGHIYYNRTSRLGVSDVEYNWERTFSHGNAHVLASRQTVAVLQVQQDTVNVITSIATSLLLLQCHFLPNDTLLLVFKDHVTVFDGTLFQILAEANASYREVSVKRLKEEVSIGLLEDTVDGHVWNRLQHRIEMEPSSTY